MDTNNSSTDSSLSPGSLLSGSASGTWWQRASAILSRWAAIGILLSQLHWAKERYVSGDRWPVGIIGLVLVLLATGSKLKDVPELVRQVLSRGK
jgi:hypothetical protein